MPSLVAGYMPATDPGVGSGVGAPSDGSGARLGVAPVNRPGGVLVNEQRRRVGIMGPPAAPELRTPGVDDRPAYHPAAAMFLRTADDTDADHFTANRGEHVAQTAGAAQPYGSQAPEPPMYGSTWRLEPQPADTGQYVGVTVNG